MTTVCLHIMLYITMAYFCTRTQMEYVYRYALITIIHVQLFFSLPAANIAKMLVNDDKSHNTSLPLSPIHALYPPSFLAYYSFQ